MAVVVVVAVVEVVVNMMAAVVFDIAELAVVSLPFVRSSVAKPAAEAVAVESSMPSILAANAVVELVPLEGFCSMQLDLAGPDIADPGPNTAAP